MAGEDAADQQFRAKFGITAQPQEGTDITHDAKGYYKEAPAAPFTVAELREALRRMPQEVTVFHPDSQNGDRPLRAVTEEINYSGARVVVLREQPE